MAAINAPSSTPASPSKDPFPPRGAVNKTRPAPVIKHRYSFWTSAPGAALTYLLTLIMWVAFNVFAQWALALILPGNTWWGWLLHVVLFGVVPFLPTWIFYLWGESSLPLDVVASGISEILIGYGKWMALIGYGGVAIYAYWGSGIIDTIFGVSSFAFPLFL